MFRYLFLAIFSCGICNFSFAQTIEDLHSEAIIFIQKEDFKRAIPMLKRCLFFAKEDSQFELLRQLGDVNFEIDSFDNAHIFYQLAIQKAPTDSLSDELIFSVANLFLKQKNPQKALTLLENNLKSSNSTYFTQRRYFYTALAHYQLHNYKASQNDFYNCFRLKNKQLDDSIRIIFEDLDNTHFYNPKKAQTLSKILPGLGQLYVKDYKNSINSFGLNAGLLALGIWSGFVYSPFNGIIWVAPWLRRYYIGGYKKAGLIAISQNEKIENAYLTQILNKIESLNLK